MKRTVLIVSMIFHLLWVSAPLWGQEVNGELSAADAAYSRYEFESALKQYEKLVREQTEPEAVSLLEDCILRCRNGISMMQAPPRPRSISSYEAQKSDFYQYLVSDVDGSWIDIPNPFLKGDIAHEYYRGCYFPKDTPIFLFSAPDTSGRWNIMFSEQKNGVWSEPQLFSEAVVSQGDDIFPFLSEDGNTLYFASNGFPGIGGYDLFVSTRNPQTGRWSEPQNMGFPYSSVSDDIAYAPLSSEGVDLIATTRYCEDDFVSLYAIEISLNPIGASIGNGESVKKIASFEPSNETSSSSTEVDPKGNKFGSYSELVIRQRQVKKNYMKKAEKAAEAQVIYEKASEDDPLFLQEILDEASNEASICRRELDSLNILIRNMEDAFLADGIIPLVVEEKQQEKKDADIQGKMPLYRFTSHLCMEMPFITIETPVEHKDEKPTFDYTFKIGKSATYAPDQKLPSGVVFQIQIAVLAKKASVKELKGLSPVYVKKLKSGKYLHTVGIFRSLQEAKEALPKVKKQGYSEAFIIAYKDGKSISLKEASAALLSKPAETFAYNVEITGYEGPLPDDVIALIQKNSNKEIMSLRSNGKEYFLVGPFSDKSAANHLCQMLRVNGVKGVNIKSIKIQ